MNQGLTFLFLPEKQNQRVNIYSVGTYITRKKTPLISVYAIELVMGVPQEPRIVRGKYKVLGRLFFWE